MVVVTNYLMGVLLGHFDFENNAMVHIVQDGVFISDKGYKFIIDLQRLSPVSGELPLHHPFEQKY